MSNFKRQKFCSQKCMAASYQAGPEEFWAKVDKGPHPKGCWLFTGFIKWDGYGWLRRVIDGKGRYLTAHRYSWYLKNGMPEDGIHILHTCDVPACCNPNHLRLGTHQDNMADCKRKNRHNSGFLKRYKPVLYPDRVRPRRTNGK